MEDILFCKDLHDSLENKGEKPVAKKDEEWRKMNRKTIGLIRQCIGHEVFHHVAQEMSAYDLWIKLEEMYQAKTSRNKALFDEDACEFEASEGDYSGGTYERVPVLTYSLTTRCRPYCFRVPCQRIWRHWWFLSAIQRRMGRKEAEVKEEVITEVLEKGWWRSQARGHTVRCFYWDQEGHIKRDCPKYKAHDQSSDTAATAVMVVDESEFDVLLAASDDGKSDWALDSGSAYHLCRDREVFSTYAACEGRIWMANNTSSRVVGRGSVWFRMADGGSVTLTESFQGKQGDAVGKEDKIYTDWRGMSRQEELLSDMGPVVLARRMDKGSNHCTEVRKASAGVPGGSGVVQERRKMLWDYGSLARHEWCNQCRMSIKKLRGRRPRRRDGATTTRKVTYFAAHLGGGVGHPSGGAGHLSEKVKALRCGVAYTSVGKWSSPLMRFKVSRMLSCSLMGELNQKLSGG
ncbi:hypothetical protein Acr_24g0007880 [Actinidia rufa]|uniref:Retrovirus-related Pol polyprotein from transposon TNT 1-94-like beta-barrel domain-containing protein n=1 Tax=Actinidia rufa TaxID=165716 RepID=A0A7J0GUZ5_9ERIC|nr:hypothetical protein Acr_24g0007880 [Actinidia rufa]